MTESQTLAVRPLVFEARIASRGVVATSTLAHCECPDYCWRDRQGKIRFCKHIIYVLANRLRAIRKGRTTFRVPSFDPGRRTKGFVYNVTIPFCRLVDGTPCPDCKPGPGSASGTLELCDHLIEAYANAGFTKPEPPVTA